MNVLYLDLGMGASGDMLLGALLMLQQDPIDALCVLNGLDERIRFEMQENEASGLRGQRVRVLVKGHEEDEVHGQEHGHGTTLADICTHIDGLPVPARVCAAAKDVYGLIAAAEAEAHGSTADSVHFHEVGALDAVADIVGCCLLMERLQPKHITASPVHVGSGTVRCAHGELPVPAPASVNLLRGIPTYGGEIAGELCTPTGAALIKYFVSEFTGMPPMRVERIGTGLGKKAFSRPNALRAFYGEAAAGEGPNDANVELSCNLDDMTGEQMGFALERLMEAGARDVCYLPAVMKKGRPAYRLLCQCAPEDADAMARLILKYTTSFGVQRVDTRRYILERKTEQKATPQGVVRVKHGTGYGVDKRKIEYEDITAIARANDLSLADALCDHGVGDF